MANERILIVDDDVIFRTLLRNALGQLGYDVLDAGDGEEGLARAVGDQPALIVLDVKMPRLDGFQVCRRLRARKEFATTPVIFLTDLDGSEDRLRGFGLGADDYLSKKLLVDEIQARVGAALDRCQRIQSGIDAQLRAPEIQEKPWLNASLQTIGLPSILNLLDVEHRSGILEVRDDDSLAQGRILLDSGDVLDVVVGERTEQSMVDALGVLLSWGRGTVTFTPRKLERRSGSGATTIQNLLLRAAAAGDEREKAEADILDADLS